MVTWSVLYLFFAMICMRCWFTSRTKEEDEKCVMCIWLYWCVFVWVCHVWIFITCLCFGQIFLHWRLIKRIFYKLPKTFCKQQRIFFANLKWRPQLLLLHLNSVEKFGVPLSVLPFKRYAISYYIKNGFNIYICFTFAFQIWTCLSYDV